MSSQTLREARVYEEVTEKKIDPSIRPAFHLCARAGWMNDPNGFSWYKGQYHLFYQYHPYTTEWGPMHWGHAVSGDLLHWTALPAALAPDEPYDCDGCFSGSALPLPDGRQLLMYTGVRREPGEFGMDIEIQTQCIATGDGTDYQKYEGNPVLTEKDLPEGASRIDFRDPKIRLRRDGGYECLIGSRPADGSGQILLYRSEDGFHWTYQKVLAENKNRFGKMWECPDFFELDGKWLLLTSPQDMAPDGYEYHNGNGTLCLIGSCDEETMEFTEEADQSIDYGIDFYAPQTVLSPDGRRIMIGWMQNWDTVAQHRVLRMPWYGQMSLPRELSVKGGRLYQQPIRELETLRKGEAVVWEGEVSAARSLPGISGRMLDLQVQLRRAEGQAYSSFTIELAKKEELYTAIRFIPAEHILEIDRRFSGSRRAIIHQRKAKVRCDDGNLDLRIILDRYSMEVFINGGEQVMTVTMFTPQEADGIAFKADGIAWMRAEKYGLAM